METVGSFSVDRSNIVILPLLDDGDTTLGEFSPSGSAVVAPTKPAGITIPGGGERRQPMFVVVLCAQSALYSGRVRGRTE